MASDGRPARGRQLLTAGKQTFASTQAISAWSRTTPTRSTTSSSRPRPTATTTRRRPAAPSHATTEPTWVTNGGTNADGTVVWTDQGLLPNGIDRGSGVSTAFGMAGALHVDVDRLGERDRQGPGLGEPDQLDGPHQRSRRSRGATSSTSARHPQRPPSRRYLRVNVTGTFTNLVAVVAAMPYRSQQSARRATDHGEGQRDPDERSRSTTIGGARQVDISGLVGHVTDQHRAARSRTSPASTRTAPSGSRCAATSRSTSPGSEDDSGRIDDIFLDPANQRDIVIVFPNRTFTGVCVIGSFNEQRNQDGSYAFTSNASQADGASLATTWS
jgi:hypothetical protein